MLTATAMMPIAAARTFACCGSSGRCAGIRCSNGRSSCVGWRAGGGRLRSGNGRRCFGRRVGFGSGLRCRRRRSRFGCDSCRSRRSRAHAKEFLRTAIRYAGNGFLQFFGHIFGLINGECAVPLRFVAVGFRAFVIHAATVLHGGIIGGGLLRCGAQTRADKCFAHVYRFGRRSGKRCGCLAGSRRRCGIGCAALVGELVASAKSGGASGE